MCGLVCWVVVVQLCCWEGVGYGLVVGYGRMQVVVVEGGVEEIWLGLVVGEGVEVQYCIEVV